MLDEVEWNPLIGGRMLRYEFCYPISINEKMRKCQKPKEKDLSTKRKGIANEMMRNNY